MSNHRRGYYLFLGVMIGIIAMTLFALSGIQKPDVGVAGLGAGPAGTGGMATAAGYGAAMAIKFPGYADQMAAGAVGPNGPAGYGYDMGDYGGHISRGGVGPYGPLGYGGYGSFGQGKGKGRSTSAHGRGAGRGIRHEGFSTDYGGDSMNGSLERRRN